MPRLTVSKADQMHPTFRKKTVYIIECKFCGLEVCKRGMKAILLADVKTELYSTDQPEREAVGLVANFYCTDSCLCKIEDVACSNCGNVIGYHVSLPCKQCLRSCNNGHFWMFHNSAIDTSERVNSSGLEVAVWGCLPDADDDTGDMIVLEECCR